MKEFTRGIFSRFAILTICFFVSSMIIASAQMTYRNMSSVHDGSGRMSTNTVLIGGKNYQHVSAAGQPGGINTNANGTLKNYAGFLQAVDIKHPNQDTDHNGVIDEIDPDNDGDLLTDIEEVDGSSFDPTTATEVNIADTDNDGITDGGEAAAGTNPTDTNSLLQIVSIEENGDDKIVEWTARGDSTVNYELVYEDTKSDGPPTTPISMGAVSGGSAPWFETTAKYTNTSAGDSRFYAVKATK